MTVAEYFGKVAKQSARIEEILSNIPEEFVATKVLRAWELGRLLEPVYENDDIKDPWLNAIAHQVAVAQLTYGLATALRAKELEISITDVVEVALIHDFNKRFEIETKQRYREEGKSVVQATIDADAEADIVLRQIGFSEKVISLTGIGGTKGIDLMFYGAPTLGHRVVFFADCCANGDRICHWRERFEAARPNYQVGGRYAGEDDEFINKYGQGVIDTYFRILEPLQNEFLEILGGMFNLTDKPNHMPIVLSTYWLTDTE